MLAKTQPPGADAAILQCRNFSELQEDQSTPPRTEMRRILEQRRHYRVFSIPKADGSRREIEDPSEATRVVADAVRKRYDQMGMDATLSRHAVGFRPGRSVMDATSVVRARLSNGSRMKYQWCLTQDLEDAFHSITEPQVRGMLRDDLQLSGFPLHLATRALTRQGRLAVGSPASPELLNLHLRRMDERLTDLASRHNAVYTRYADDLTFLGEGQHWTGHRHKTTSRSWWTWFAKQVRRIIREEGMAPHPAKSSLTKFDGPRSAPSAEVLGHTVRKKGNTAPTRRTKRRARAARHRFRMAGYRLKGERDTGKSFLSSVSDQEALHSLQEAQGLLAWNFLTKGFRKRPRRLTRSSKAPPPLWGNHGKRLGLS